MKRFLTTIRNEEGSALMAAFWMLVVLLLAGLAASYSTTTEVGLSGNEKLDAQLFYLAEAGVAQVKKHLDGLGVPFDGSGPNNDAPVQIYLEEQIGAVSGVSGTFTAYIDPQERVAGMPNRYLAITVRARMSGSPLVRVVQERVGQENFARFSYFTDQETSPGGLTVWFRSDDILRGPVHSNDQLNIDGDPIFVKEVTSSASSVNYAAGTNNPDFREGIEFNVDPITLPSDIGLIQLKAQETDGHHFTGNVDIVLGYDEPTDYSWFTVDMDQGGPALPVEYQIPGNGVLYVDGNMTIQGTLKGVMTVACSGDMYIVDNVEYTTDPRVDPSTSDLLGLVAEGNVIVAASAANIDTGDEIIMAVIMALSTSFIVEDYDIGTVRGTLWVIGGVIQQKRGPVGTFDSISGDLLTGYTKDYVWDSRLADNPPPAFPTTGRVMTLAWRELDPNVDISANVF